MQALTAPACGTSVGPLAEATSTGWLFPAQPTALGGSRPGSGGGRRSRLRAEGQRQLSVVGSLARMKQGATQPTGISPRFMGSARLEGDQAVARVALARRHARRAPKSSAATTKEMAQ